jgi:hypothetical protein
MVGESHQPCLGVLSFCRPDELAGGGLLCLSLPEELPVAVAAGYARIRSHGAVVESEDGWQSGLLRQS